MGEMEETAAAAKDLRENEDCWFWGSTSLCMNK
jgi:hypothetical protein